MGGGGRRAAAGGRGGEGQARSRRCAPHLEEDDDERPAERRELREQGRLSWREPQVVAVEALTLQSLVEAEESERHVCGGGRGHRRSDAGRVVGVGGRDAGDKGDGDAGGVCAGEEAQQRRV